MTMGTDNLKERFAKMDSREILDILRFKRQDYTDNAVTCMEEILAERFKLSNIKNLDHIDNLIKKNEDEKEAKVRKIIESQMASINMCGSLNNIIKIPFYAAKMDEQKYENVLSSVLTGASISAVTLPTIGVAGFNLEKNKKYEIYRADFILCEKCLSINKVDRDFVEKNNLLISKLNDNGFEIFTEKEFKNYFVES